MHINLNSYLHDLPSLYSLKHDQVFWGFFFACAGVHKGRSRVPLIFPFCNTGGNYSSLSSNIPFITELLQMLACFDWYNWFYSNLNNQRKSNCEPSHNCCTQQTYSLCILQRYIISLHLKQEAQTCSSMSMPWQSSMKTRAATEYPYQPARQQTRSSMQKEQHVRILSIHETVDEKYPDDLLLLQHGTTGHCGYCDIP